MPQKHVAEAGVFRSVADLQAAINRFLKSDAERSDSRPNAVDAPTGDWALTLARLLEDSSAGEERGAVRCLRHREKLRALVVEQDPAAVASDDRPDAA